jgi:hypothetical protein
VNCFDFESGHDFNSLQGDDEIVELAIPASTAVEDVSVKQALLDFKFWLLFSVFCIAAGGGLMLINNVAEIYKSLHNGGTSGKALLVSLLGNIELQCVSQVVNSPPKPYWGN